MSGVLHDYQNMLSDEIRTGAYRKAILAQVKPGDVVIDFGSGSGVMALFAAQAGAKRVYALEYHTVAEAIREMARRNGYEDVITVIRSRGEDAQLPEQADWIIWEMINTTGCDEYDMQALKKVIARDLKPGGGLIPQRVRHYLRLRSQADLYEHYVDYWSKRPFDLDWSLMREQIPAMVIHTPITSGRWLSDAHLWWDLKPLEQEMPSYQKMQGLPADWQLNSEGICHGVQAYFEADLGAGIELSDSPDAPLTCWEHDFHAFPSPLDLKAGDRVELNFGYGFTAGNRFYPRSLRHSRDGRCIDEQAVKDLILDYYTKDDLARVTGRFAPQLDPETEKLASLLALVDGSRTAKAIAQNLAENCPKLFESEEAALDYLVNQWRKRPLRRE